MFRRLAFAGLALGLATTWATAAEYGTTEEAKALAVRAAEFVKLNGVEKARERFARPDGGFQDRDLYPFIQDRSGVILAHGTSPALVGRNILHMKDVDGTPFPREIVAVKAPAWVDYRWQHPQTREVTAKSTYVIPVNTRRGEVLVAVGAYRP
jgi:cytochrome c